MQPFFTDYLERLTALHDEIIVVLERLPQAALDWMPAPQMNSIAVLIAHTVGAEQYWIGDMTVRGTSQRVRETEFQTTGLDHTTLKRLLDAAVADARKTVGALTVAQLTEERNSPMHDQSFTVGWCLLHALEHTATHVGHVQLMGDMWEEFFASQI